MNCLKCGSCCKAFGIVEVEEGFPKELTVESELPYRIMKTNGFTCICLKDNLCSIYENRPKVCKIVVPGGIICQMARRQIDENICRDG